VNWFAHSQYEGFAEYEPGCRVIALAREALELALESFLLEPVEWSLAEDSRPAIGFVRKED